MAAAGRGRRVAALCALAGLALLAGTGFLFRRGMVEEWWIRRLESPDRAVCLEAARELARLGSKRGAPHLARAFLRHLPESSLAKDLLPVLAEAHPEVLLDVFRTISEDGLTRLARLIDDEKSFDLDVLAGPLRSGEPRVQLAVMECLAVRSFPPMLEHWSLWRKGDSRDILEALESLVSRPAPLDVRFEAACLLSIPGQCSRVVRASLREAYRNGDPSRRRRAVQALLDASAATRVDPVARAALQDPDVEVRRQAAQFQRVGPGSFHAIPDLIQALEDRDEQVRSHAGRALQEILSGIRGLVDLAHAVPRLVEGLRSDNALARTRSLEALSLLRSGIEPAVPALTEVLQDSSLKMRLLAARALGRAGPASLPALPGLMEALDSTDAPLRAAAAEAIGALGPAAAPAVKALLGLVEEPRGVGLSVIVKALGAVGEEAREAIPALIAILRDRNEATAGRRDAAEALSRIGPRSPEVLEALLEVFQGGGVVPFLNDVVGRALGRLQMPEALPALLEGLESLSPSIVRAALQGLAETGPRARDAVPSLRRSLAVDDEPAVRLLRLRALWRTGGEPEEVLPELIALGQQPGQRHVQLEAVRLLGELGPFAEPALSAIFPSTRNQDLQEGVTQPAPAQGILVSIPVDPVLESEVVLEFSRTLASIGRAAVPALLKGLASDDVEARYRCAATLADIGPDAAEARAALEAALGDDDEDLRREATRALERIDGERR